MKKETNYNWVGSVCVLVSFLVAFLTAGILIEKQIPQAPVVINIQNQKPDSEDLKQPSWKERQPDNDAKSSPAYEATPDTLPKEELENIKKNNR